MRLQRRHWVTATALAAAAAAIFVVWNHTGFAAREVSQRLTENLLRDHGYRFEVRAVRGTPLGDLHFIDARITTLETPPRTVLRADAVRVRFRSVRGMLRGRVAIGHVRLDRPRLEWPDEWPARAGAASAPADGTSRFPLLEIDAVDVVGATIVRGADSVATEVDARFRVRSRRDRVELEIDHGRGRLPADSLRVESLRTDMVWSGDSLVIAHLDIATAASQLVGSGVVQPRLRKGDAALVLEPLDIAELGRIVPAARRRGVVRGDLRVEWRAPETRFAGTLAGSVGEWKVPNATVDLVVGPDGLRITDARGRVGDAEVAVEADLRGGGMVGDMQFTDLDLRPFVPEHATALPPHRLDGRATFARRGGGDSLRVDLQLQASQVGELALDRAVGRVVWHAGTARVTGARIDTPAGNALANGVVSSDAVAGEFTIETADLAAALAVWGQDGPAGDLRLQGRIDGTPAAPRLEAEGTFTAWRWGPARARGGRLAIWGHDLRALRADAEVRADSLWLDGRQLHDLGADLELAGPVLRIARAQASHGDTLVAVVATLDSRAADWAGTRAATSHLRLETVLLRLGAHELRVEDPADVWWRGKHVRFDSLRVVTRGGSVRADGSLDFAARSLGVRAEAAGVDLAFVAAMMPAQPPLGGRAWGHVVAAGSFDATRIEGALHVTDGHWGDFAVDSLGVAVHSLAAGVEAGDVRIATPYGNVRGALRLGRLPAIARLWGETPAASRPFAASSIDGTLHLQDVDVARWVAHGDPGATPRFGARVSADVTLAGSLGAPRLQIEGHGEQVAVGPRGIGSVDFALDYADERLVLRHARVQNEEEQVRIRADVPLVIDFTRGIEMRREESFTAELVLPRSSFALLQRFIPIFEPGLPGMDPGQVEAELDVTGTIAAPQIRGVYRVYDASFTLRDMEEIYRDVDVVGEFVGSTLRFTQISARTGREGVVTGTGQLDLDGGVLSDYVYELDLVAVPVYSLPEVTATVDGHLQVRAARVGAETIVPNIRGTLDVRDALITQEFTAGGDELFDTDTPEWLSDITLRAPQGNVRMRNSQVEADLAGSLRIVRTRRQLDLQGEVTVRRGRYLDLLNYFRITGGHLDFSANPGFNPALDIQGESGRPGNRVYVHLTGSAMAPQLSFRSEREGVEGAAQIEEQVIGRIGSGGAVASNALATVGGGLLRELEFLRGRNITVDPAGEDPWDEPGDTRNEFGVNLSTGFAVSDNAYLVYTQGVKSDIQQKAALEIDLRRWPLLLEAAYERRNLSEGGPDQSQNAFDINLKYRHEY
jgi:hypothetical protein